MGAVAFSRSGDPAIGEFADALSKHADEILNDLPGPKLQVAVGQIFSALSDDGLLKKTITPDGASITLIKWLRLMIEHEIHHRGQIYIYLAMLDVPTPPLYGLTEEQVRERSK